MIRWRTGPADFNDDANSRLHSRSTQAEGSTVSTRRRVKQVHSLQDRLTSFAQDARARAQLLPPGAEQEAMLEKARQAEAALRFSNWANSSGLQPPK